MPSISKMSDECKKCPHVNDCDNKRMVCAMIECKPNTADTTTSVTMPHTQSMIRVEHPITINMGEYGTINTSHEEVSEKLKKDFYKNLNCSFYK